jgi:CRP/FNR family transcriptional regulator
MAFDIADYFPIWNKMTEEDRKLLKQSAALRTAPKGTLLHSGSEDCVGLFIIRSGQLRAFILSDEGKEITIYRLFERDICLFSASCMINSIQFDITIQAEKDTELWIIDPDVYKRIMDGSAVVANYTNELMATRFSEVMWLIEQILWKSFDRRLAAFLLEESAIEGSDVLKITHDRIAAHMGTAREVVTRMLRYFQSEGMVTLSRGNVELTDPERLRELSE